MSAFVDSASVVGARLKQVVDVGQGRGKALKMLHTLPLVEVLDYGKDEKVGGGGGGGLRIRPSLMVCDRAGRVCVRRSIHSKVWTAPTPPGHSKRARFLVVFCLPYGFAGAWPIFAGGIFDIENQKRNHRKNCKN